MNLFRLLRTRLAWKLFLSYLTVIVVGVVVLASAAEAVIPASFDRHMAFMNAMMGGAMMGSQGDLFTNYRAAVTEALVVASLAAGAAALVVSFMVSRRVVDPVRAMTDASRRISEGHFDERVPLRGSASPAEQDELDQLAVSFNQMAHKLDQTETMRRQLIGDVAHELRTPLASIKGTLEALMDGVLPADEEHLLQLHREADRLQRLVNDLQELSRVESGALTLERRAVSIAELIAPAVSRLERQYEEKDVRLEVDLPTKLPAVLADPDRITQVLLNLLGNALQYSPAGRSVRLTALARKGAVEIAVHDQGVGIAPEHLPHVFTRFYRADPSRARAGGGSGIGLTIARHLVEAHGGRIAASSPGRGLGSTFTFTLPVT